MIGAHRRREKQRPLPESVVGTFEINEKEFKKKFGLVAFHVWTMLVQTREGPRFESQLSAKTISRCLKVCERTAKRAIKRLVDAGLVSKGRKELLKVRGPNGEKRWDSYRTIYGLEPYDMKPHLYTVPEKAIEWIDEKKRQDKRGGSRKGAGRKPKGVKSKAQIRRETAQSKVSPWDNQNLSLTQSKVAQPLKKHSLKRVNASYEATTPSTVVAQPKISSEPRDEIQGVTTHNAPSLPSSREVSEEVARQLDEAFEGDIESEGSKPARRFHPVEAGHRYEGVPGPFWVPEEAPIRLPNRPVLSAADTVERNVFLLKSWYEGAVEKATGKRPWLMGRKGPLTKHAKHWKLLVAASEAFIERGIEPAAWCEYMVDLWFELNPKKRDVPPQFVFSTVEIRRPRGWFSNEAPNYRGGDLVFTDTMSELMRRQASMRIALAREQAFEPDDVARVVSIYFPGDLYESLVERVRREADDMTRHLRLQAANGTWIW